MAGLLVCYHNIPTSYRCSGPETCTEHKSGAPSHRIENFTTLAWVLSVVACKKPLIPEAVH